MGLLAGKVAIITGAASERGMGRATAIKMAQEGAKVVVTDLAKEGDTSLIDQTVAEIKAQGGEAIGIAVDVTNEEQIKACVDQVLNAYGQIDVLFNNAGVPFGVGKFLELSQADWEISINVNLYGMVKFVRAVIPHMIEQGKGAIVNNASTLGLGGMPEFSAYGASKFAVVGMTKHLASEFGTQGVRINCVCPGMIDTKMSDIEVEGFMEQMNVSREEAVAQLSAYVPLGKYGDPDEVADAVIYLASDKARYVTGVAMPVAGGFPAGL